MAKLGQLVIELAANSARLQSDMGKAIGIAEKAASRIKTAFKFAGGGLIGAALANTVKQSIEFGDAISKAASKAGIGARAMSELAYAAKLADVDVTALSTAIKKMQVSLSEAGTGAKGPTQALAALGLTIQDLQKRKPDTQFDLLAQRISELKDPADRARAATELFGKAGADLLPLFEQGATGIRQAREEARKLGLSFSDEQINALAQADEATKHLHASWQGFTATMTSKFAPTLVRILNLLSGIDTRTVEEKLSGEIVRIEQELKNRNFGMGGGVGGMSAEREAALYRELRSLQLRRDLLGQPRLGSGEPGRGRYMGTPIGYAAAAVNEEAEAAAKKAQEERQREHERFIRTWAADEHDMYLSTMRFSEEMKDKVLSDLDEWSAEQRNVHLRNLEYFQEQRKELSGVARTFRDAFLNAWDDMVNTGKFKWDELLKYMIAEFARRGIAKLFDSLFLSKEGGGKGLGGALDSALNWGKKLLGFADGGRPPMNKPSIIGENGPELFWPDTAGTIVPNYGMAGGGFNLTINMDNRGASQELIRVLPAFGRDLANTVEARVIEGLRRRKYRLI